MTSALNQETVTETFIIYLEPNPQSAFARSLSQARELLACSVGYDDSHLYPLHCSATSFFDITIPVTDQAQTEVNGFQAEVAVTNAEGEGFPRKTISATALPSFDVTADTSDAGGIRVPLSSFTDQHEADLLAALPAELPASPAGETLASNLIGYFGNLVSSPPANSASAPGDITGACDSSLLSSTAQSPSWMRSQSSSNPDADVATATTVNAPTAVATKNLSEPENGRKQSEEIYAPAADGAMTAGLITPIPENKPISDSINLPSRGLLKTLSEVSTTCSSTASDIHGEYHSQSAGSLFSSSKWLRTTATRSSVFEVKRAPNKGPINHSELKHVCISSSGAVVFPIESSWFETSVHALCKCLQGAIMKQYPNATIKLSRRQGVTGIKAKPGTHVKLFEAKSADESFLGHVARFLDLAAASQWSPLYWDVVLYKLNSWGELHNLDKTSGRAAECRPHDLVEVVRIQNAGVMLSTYAPLPPPSY